MITIDPPSRFEATLSSPALLRFLARARAAVGLPGAVDVLLSNDSTLRDLNRNFRGKDKPTDVLSFPAPAEFATRHAGDLAISLDTAARQAATFGHTLRDEVRILLLHGLLHLSGHDHETDSGEMATREASLRRELNLPNTLIERTTAKKPSAKKRDTKKNATKKTPSHPTPKNRATPTARSKRGSQ